MLESMVESTSPDRSEMTDITSSTLDGTDSFILSHETSIGQNAIQSVINLAKSIAEAESIFDYEQAYVNIREDIR